MNKETSCEHCRATAWIYHFNGRASCSSCGILSFVSNSVQPNYLHAFQAMNRLQQNHVYTREKRFKKYIQHAARQQSMNSIPDKTWEYLLAHKPYRRVSDILRTLKKSKLKNKCYDCLPMMVNELCDHIRVPKLSNEECREALDLFGEIDRNYDDSKCAFVSYIFILEYILEIMGRSDILPFLSRIQCSKRRTVYRRKLNAIFNHTSFS